MTPERFSRLRRVLARRQPDLTVLLDNVHKPHNLSAIVRTCDSVGVFVVHAVWPDPRLKPNHMTSGGTGRWVEVATHRTLDDAMARLRGEGHQVVAAHPSSGAEDFRCVDYTRPTVLLLGAELDGVSDRAAALSDRQILIPMAGMAASLNVSVAAAVVLFEAQRQRELAGLYDGIRLESNVYSKTLFEWAHPEVARYCRQHNRSYPELDDEGEIVGEFRAE